MNRGRKAGSSVGCAMLIVPFTLGAAVAGADESYAKRVAGGNINGYLVDESHFVIRVAPGEPITGTINVEAYYAGSSGAIVPFGYTVDWGVREEQAVLTNGNMPHAPTTHAVPINKTAPATPGTYHIIVAFAGRYTIDQVMSETKQDVPGNPIWNDGNDVGFDWTCDQINDALFVGTVDSQTWTLQGFVWGRIGATAVIVHVEADESYVRRVAGGSLNGYPIDETHYEVWATPGELISGTICVETYYAGSPGAVVPFGYTVDWGLREVQAVSGGAISHAPTTRCVSISKVAAMAPGDYHIVLAMAGRYTIEQVMSETKQDVEGNPIWYDGNDVAFDWTCEQFKEALFVGTVDSQTLTPPGYVWGRMGAGAVLVHVTDTDCNNNGIPDEQDIADCGGSSWCSDCNNNEILDECDIADGTSTDCQPNGIPDECELDRVLFEDDFANGLSQWTIVSEGDNTCNAEIVFGEGNPDPALLLDDLASYHCFANSNTTFSHVGRVLEISADLKHGNAGSSLQRHATFRLTGLDGLLDHDFFIAGMGVSASTNPSYPNTVNCTIRFNDEGVDAWETSGFLPIPSGDGWHTGTMVIQLDGRVEFYLDDEWVYTSTNPIISRFDGEEVIQLGSRRSFYDNVRVTVRGMNDCNGNGIPDECDIADCDGSLSCGDCNGNGIPDECDIADCDGSLSCGDCNGNGVPDGCEDDCDGDGLIDVCDPDIDNDGVLNGEDVCDYTPSSAFVEPDGSLLGDFDGDCDVDLDDFASFQERITGPGCRQ